MGLTNLWDHICMMIRSHGYNSTYPIHRQDAKSNQSYRCKSKTLNPNDRRNELDEKDAESAVLVKPTLHHRCIRWLSDRPTPKHRCKFWCQMETSQIALRHRFNRRVTQRHRCNQHTIVQRRCRVHSRQVFSTGRIDAPSEQASVQWHQQEKDQVQRLREDQVSPV